MTGGIPDQYQQVSSWCQGVAQERWYCSSPVSHSWCPQCGQSNHGGDTYEVCQVSRYSYTIVAFIFLMKVSITKSINITKMFSMILSFISSGGFIGLFSMFGAYQRWCRTTSTRAQYFEKMLEMCDVWPF